ncbi:hypothetical protein PHYPSEUDO_015446 [Phytophthora pseudosyringae]|uniref:Homeobox domain-containing protein n=1 Tax=Phytophthora pseudosyringae TaxID=221518 RepID=A0A8T1VYU0_9STRA|nr:hypothetical protein PHYPSEUDO_015446 [Phytophthora pseudosyringae]
MTFPNRINCRLRSRERSRPQSENGLTASDAPVGTSFAAFCQVAPSDCDAEEEEKHKLGQNANFVHLSAVHDNALLPLTHKLMAMTAQPAKLLAALVVDCGGRTSKQAFWAKAAAYQHSELQGLSASWVRVVADMAQRELSATDAMMSKATLYYWRMWQYVCAACVDAVASIEESATSPQQPLKREEPRPWTSLLQKRSAASISPPLEDKCSDALSQGMILSGGSGLAKRSRISRKSNEFLIAWFLAHKDNPYPSSDERAEIAEKTELAEQQVRNWFANMRKRHWKPNRANAKKPRCLVDYMLRQTDD